MKILAMKETLEEEMDIVTMRMRTMTMTTLMEEEEEGKENEKM